MLLRQKNGGKATLLAYSGSGDSSRLTSIFSGEGSVSYTYLGGTHRISSATDSLGVSANYTYNANGLVTSSVITPASGSGQIYSGAAYDNYGNLTCETDTFGSAANYSYDTNRGLLSYVTNANNHRTQYIYDIGGRLAGVFADNDNDGICDASEAVVNYTYSVKNYLTEIYNGATTYHLSYDNYGNVTGICIGAAVTPLVSYVYGPQNGKLMSVTYADGTVISNTYDTLNRISSVAYNGTVAYTVVYYSDGNVCSYTDCATGRVYRYEYDALGRAVRFFVTLNGAELYSAARSYDDNWQVVGYAYNISDVGSRETSNTYGTAGMLTGENTAGGDAITYTYDGFGRLLGRTLGVFSEHYEYQTSSVNTSARISKILYKQNGAAYKTVLYTYDDLGNILTEDDGTTFRSYTYDSLNQLATELYYEKATEIGKYRYYFTSKTGNLSYVEFDYNNGQYLNSNSSGHAYGSGTDWKELLTTFDGVQITYDANGNPISYYNGENYAFTWQKGRQLASATNGTNTITFQYDATGRRISKTVNGETHEYIYDGSQLLCDKWDGKYIEYFYDAGGSPYALSYYNGSSTEKFYFVKNAEGDILELRTASGALCASYVYDAWGKIVSVKNSAGTEITAQTHIAKLSCLRYRGYVYDVETGLYYLESRYYDPAVGRFINADGQLTIGCDLTGLNLFAYCGNNPANRIDPTGEAWWHWAIGAAVVAACAVATVITCGGFAAAATAVCLVANGVAAATTASTIVTGAFVGSATVYGMAVLTAAATSDSVQEFYDQGNWETVAVTVFGGVTGGYDGYTMSKAQTRTSTQTGNGTQNPKVKAAIQKG